MIVVAHRRNDPDALAATPPSLGVEVDVRPFGDRLVVAHDPHEDGVEWSAWLAGYRHRLLVVNTKAEGLVAPVLASLDRAGITEAFVLGPDAGEALGFWDRGERRIALRVSEVHAPAVALALAAKLAWVWLDSFRGGVPLTPGEARALRDAGLRVCGVSPELYGREGAAPAYRAALDAVGLTLDAVCTREPGSWTT